MDGIERDLRIYFFLTVFTLFSNPIEMSEALKTNYHSYHKHGIGKYLIIAIAALQLPRYLCIIKIIQTHKILLSWLKLQKVLPI